MADQPKVRRRTSGRPRINWGRGRLGPFDSMAAFAARFCSLNGINPKEFRDFLSNYLGNDKWTVRGFAPSDLESLADVLDEPMQVVRTLAADALALPPLFGSFASDYDDRTLRGYVSYCPTCLRLGYHASFHEHVWLYRCPIHYEPLCRSAERLASRSFDDQHVHEVGKLLEAANPKWLECRSSVWSDSAGKKSFAHYYRWMRGIKKLAAAMYCLDIGRLDETPYRFEDLPVLLGRIDAVQRVPCRVRELLLTEPRAADWTRLSLTKTASASLREAACRVPLVALVWFYSRWVALNTVPTAHQAEAKQAIDELENAHRICHCGWNMNPYCGAGWRSARPPPKWRPASWRNGIRLGFNACPFATAIRELNEEWLTFVPEDAHYNDRGRLLERYEELEAQLIALGIVQSTGATVARPFGPLDSGWTWTGLDMVWDPTLAEGLELVLREVVRAHVDRIKIWLGSIDHLSPPVRFLGPGSVNVFCNTEQGLISSWRPHEGAGQTAGHRWAQGVVGSNVTSDPRQLELPLTRQRYPSPLASALRDASS